MSGIREKLHQMIVHHRLETQQICAWHISGINMCWLYAETEECMEMKMIDTTRNGII